MDRTVVRMPSAISHGKMPRGLQSAGKAEKRGPLSGPPFGSRFGRFFDKSSNGVFDEPDLKELADRMVAPLDRPKDGFDDEESGIPALFTYLGQFIDHDVTFDPEGKFQKQRDAEATIDFRTPAFDLDNVYGRGPGDQPYIYDDHNNFVLGDPIANGAPNGQAARDLPRSPAGRALIGDPRNDENAIVSQLQGLFLRFHNRVMVTVGQNFDEAQAITRAHYQYVVIHDFLPKIVNAKVLDSLKTRGQYDPNKLTLYAGLDLNSPFMPVEFSIAAYRLGHSMVRPGYRLNDAVLAPIFPVSDGSGPDLPEGLTGFRRLISNWAIDWSRFIDLEIRPYGPDPDNLPGPQDPARDQALRDLGRRLQFAYRIDTSLVDPLGVLPKSVVGELSVANPASLALRNLLRGSEFGLVTGQEAASLMKVPHISESQILVRKKGRPRTETEPVSAVASAFKRRCPLWTYVLAEAMQSEQQMRIPVDGHADPVGTPQLGPVGGGIVAQVFLAMLFADPVSFLNKKPDWRPNGGAFGLKQLVEYALGGTVDVKKLPWDWQIS